MTKIIVWALGVILGTSGQNLVLQEDVDTLVIKERKTLSLPFTAQEKTDILSAIVDCYSGPLSEVSGMEFKRGTGANVDNIYVDIVGEHTLTQQEAETRLLNNQSLSVGLKEPINVRDCQIVGGGKLGALASALGQAWSDSVHYVTTISIERTTDGPRLVYADGIKTVTVAQAVTLAATQNVEVLGKVAEQ